MYHHQRNHGHFGSFTAFSECKLQDEISNLLICRCVFNHVNLGKKQNKKKVINLGIKKNSFVFNDCLKSGIHNQHRTQKVRLLSQVVDLFL